MEEWGTYKLSEISSFKTGKLDSNASCEGGKYPFFTCSPETLSINQYAFDQKAILLAGNNAEGNFNVKYYEGKFNAYQRTYVFTANEKKVIPYFLFYALKICLNDFKQMSQGTSTKFLTAKILNSFEVKLPPISIQAKIVNLLRSIDEKVALNNRINHNLEEQADSLILSAIETQSIGSAHLRDICSYVTERVNSDTLNNENYISTDNMFANRGGVGIAAKIPGGKCTSFKAQDVLVSNIRPYFKKVWRASFSGGCSNDVLCFRTTTGTSSFLYHLLRSDVFFEYVMSGAKGSKMPRGDKLHILNWVIPVFETDCIASLEGALEEIDDRVAITQEENRRLSAIRDSLLPMLMSNSISINDLTC